MELPASSQTYVVSHVSSLKDKFGKNVFSQSQLPLIRAGKVSPMTPSNAGLKTKGKKVEIQIYRQGLSHTDATWEDAE